MDEYQSSATGKLLYDPMFEKKPDIEIHDDVSKGFFGKTKVKKTFFILALALFIGVSLFMSFYSVSSDKYKFEENGQGYLLYDFHGGERDKVLNLDFVCDDNENRDLDKPVNEVRKFAICCNEYLEYIFISKTVEKIDSTSFYSCNALKAIIVDPENENYASVDGVLYKKENGVLSEILLYPEKNGYYRSELALGFKALAKADETEEYMKAVSDKSEAIAEEYKSTGTKYEIADTVTKIGELAFTTCKELEYVKIPDGVKEIETLAFFKCESLKTLRLPDALEVIGSDAFSSCKSIGYIFIPASVKEIGHHAFNSCNSAKSVYMGHENDEGIILGDQWAPQTRKVFMHSVEVLYNQTREGE